jgi:hypothetical protein
MSGQSKYQTGEFAWVYPEEFVRTWQAAKTLREVCTKLRMRKAAAKLRAYRYRRFHGIPLKAFDAGPGGAGASEEYWERLAQLAAELVPPANNTIAEAPPAPGVAAPSRPDEQG